MVIPATESDALRCEKEPRPRCRYATRWVVLDREPQASRALQPGLNCEDSLSPTTWEIFAYTRSIPSEEDLRD